MYLFSDGRVLDAAEVTIRGNLHVRESRDQRSPVILRSSRLSAKRNYERPTKCRSSRRLANFGPEPVEVPGAVKLDGELSMSAAAANR